MKLLLTILLFISTLYANEVQTLQWPKGDSFLNFLEKNDIPHTLYFDKDEQDKELLSEITAGIDYQIMYDDKKQIKQILIPVSEELQIHIRYIDKK